MSEKFASIMQHITGDEIRLGNVLSTLLLRSFISYCLELFKRDAFSCRYLHFDFHRICGHIHFERLSILYEQIEGFLEQNGYVLL